MKHEKLANEIIAQSIALNNLDFFLQRVDESLLNATKMLQNIDSEIASDFGTSLKPLMSELKQDFKQIEDKIQKQEIKYDMPKEKIKDKEIEPKKWFMHYPHRRLSFKQSIRSKIKEFLTYIDKAYDYFKKIKLRFKKFDLEKYKNILRNLTYNTL